MTYFWKIAKLQRVKSKLWFHFRPEAAGELAEFDEGGPERAAHRTAEVVDGCAAAVTTAPEERFPIDWRFF